MRRAAILIGVTRTGGLPALQAVASSLSAMRGWCVAQGITGDALRELHDAGGGSVSVDDVFDTVRTMQAAGTIEQLIVYFSGHGLNIGGQEFWLLSDAPADPSEAVNLEASIVLARRSRIPHVVFLSDACRSAPATVQEQGVTGSAVFPNIAPQGTEQSVDVFFGCTLGDPSLELRSASGGGEFRALFTESLVDALSGRAPGVLERDTASGSWVVRGWPLKEHLRHEVTRRLRDAGLSLQARQTPDARITSPPTAWLSRLPDTGPAAPASGAAPADGAAPAPMAPPAMTPRTGMSLPAEPPVAASGTWMRLLQASLQGGNEVPVAAAPAPGSPLARDPKLRHIWIAMQRRRAELRQSRQCRIELDGMDAVDALMPDAEPVVAGRVVVADVPGEGAGTLLLVLASGQGMLLPALPGYVVRMRFDSGDVASLRYDVAAEPGRPSSETPQGALRRMVGEHALLASRQGGLRLDGEAGRMLESLVLSQRPVDPVLALFTAYAAHDLGRSPLLQEICHRLGRDLDADLFDTAMLAGRFFDGNHGLHVHPFVPLLSQGWGLLDVYGVALPAVARELRHHRTNSLWSIYDAAGVALLRDCVHSRCDGAWN